MIIVWVLAFGWLAFLTAGIGLLACEMSRPTVASAHVALRASGLTSDDDESVTPR